MDGEEKRTSIHRPQTRRPQQICCSGTVASDFFVSGSGKERVCAHVEHDAWEVA